MARGASFGPETIAAFIRRLKEHPWVFIAGSVLALFAVLTQVVDIFGGISGGVHARLNPHERDYRQLAGLELGVTPQYLEGWLGEPKRTADVCRSTAVCPRGASKLTMNLYQSDLVSVRAVFVERRLDWYTVSLRSDDLEPPMSWLHHDLGALGQVSYTAATRVAGVEPTDVDMFLGPRSSAYVEVFAGGAPADYHGLILASAPDEPPGAHFDRGSAGDLLALDDQPFDSQVASRFRSRSRPTTFGEFNDDGGVVSRIAEVAENDRILLYEFSDA